jgi:hypothetical protein
MSAFGAADVQRADGYYLYSVGAKIHALADFSWQDSPERKATTYGSAYFPLIIAEMELQSFLNRSIFQIRMSLVAGNLLLNSVTELKNKITNEEDKNKTLDAFDVFRITNGLTNFEAVLGAELGMKPFYLVTQKAGYETDTIINNGVACFPSELPIKVPEAVADINHATRCIAFELFTGAGFHLHRANESVLHRYWDAVSNGAGRPKSRNMGDYLVEMSKSKIGDDRVKSALKDLKDLHRNPLIYPEHSIDNVDEAVALMNGVHNVMVHMLKSIPYVMPIPLHSTS